MPPLEGEPQSFATSIPRLQTITSTRAPASTPDQGTMTPEALTYYCAGQAGMQMSQSISTSQMLRFSACFEQNKHRIR
jgi:hypothetical protein